MSLVPLPSLDQLAADPSKAAALSADTVEALLARCSVVQTVLIGRLLAYRVQGDASGQAQADGDRLLDIRQAAQKLGTSRDWLYRRAEKLPFVMRLGRQLRFSEKGIDRYIRQRQGR